MLWAGLARRLVPFESARALRRAFLHGSKRCNYVEYPTREKPRRHAGTKIRRLAQHNAVLNIMITGHVQRSYERLFADDLAPTVGNILTQRAFADLQICIDERSQLRADAHRRYLR